MRTLSGWLYWEEAFLIWLSTRHILSRLFVKLYVLAMSVLVCSTARNRAHDLAMRMFRWLRSFSMILMWRGLLNTPKLAMFPLPSPSRGLKELFV